MADTPGCTGCVSFAPTPAERAEPATDRAEATIERALVVRNKGPLNGFKGTLDGVIGTLGGGLGSGQLPETVLVSRLASVLLNAAGCVGLPPSAKRAAP